jgi:hypothetical protein
MWIVNSLTEPVGGLGLLLLLSLFISEMHPAIGCLALAGAVALGATRQPWRTLPMLTVGAAALNLAFLLSQWRIVAALGFGGVRGWSSARGSRRYLQWRMGAGAVRYLARPGCDALRRRACPPHHIGSMRGQNASGKASQLLRRSAGLRR